MDIERIRALVLALPEVAAWPEMAAKFERAASEAVVAGWRLPLLACQAVGGDVSAALSGAAAMACWAIGFMLVDDILDEDPRGEYVRSGVGPTANLALAFQAVAFRIVQQTPISALRRAATSASLASMSLTTALGQHWDAQDLDGEEDYWRVVQAKSVPFHSTALQIGALLGSATPEVAQGLHDLGALLGEIVQIHDDLLDAFETPANPDWTQGRNNLAILYARTADHAQRDRFMALLSQIEDPQALREAQRILIRCGAVSYCAYHLIGRYQKARQLLAGIPLSDPAPMVDLLEQQIRPLVQWLQARGLELTVALTELAP